MEKDLRSHTTIWTSGLRPFLTGAWDSLRWLDRPASWSLLCKHIRNAQYHHVHESCWVQSQGLGCSHNQSRHLTAVPRHLPLGTSVLVTSSWPNSFPMTKERPMNDIHLRLVIGDLELYPYHLIYGSLWLVDLYRAWPWNCSIMRSMVSILLGHCGWFPVYPQIFIIRWPADYQILGQTGLRKNFPF